MAAVWDEICKEATCPMCFELYEEPKILPCLHTFCKKCLISERGMAANSGLVTRYYEERKCCFCPEVFTLNSVENFPTNAAVLHLVESVVKYHQFSKQAPPLCQSCAYESQAGLAVASCLHCNIFLCTKCVTVHKRLPLTSIHRVVRLNDVKSGKVDLNSVLNCKQGLCSIHHDRPLELFCKKERCFLCLGCAIVQHRDHPYDFISQVVTEQRGKMKLLMPDVKVKINKLEQAITEIERRQLLIQERRKENVMKIEQTFEEAIAAVVQRKEELLDRVNKTVEGKIQSLSKQLNKVEILLYQMKQYLEFTEKTIESESNHTVICMTNPVTDRGRSLVQLFSETKLTPSEPLPRKIEFQTLDSLVMMIKQLAKVPSTKSCIVEMDKIPVHEHFCQFTLKVKNSSGDPILGYASSVNAMFSTSKDDGPMTPLQVYDAGNGNYVFCNNYRSYCKKCNEPLKRMGNNQYLIPFCYHCEQHSPLVWNQWVSVLINGKHVPGSPFK